MSQQLAAPAAFFAGTREQAVFSAEGPHPQFLLDSEHAAVVVVGLEPGQQIPMHPERMVTYHFLQGSGVVFVEETQYAVTAGATVIVPAGARRGMRADERMVFLGVKSA